MSYRNQTGLCGLLIGCTLAVASACGGLDSVTVVIKGDGGTGNPSGGGHPGGGMSKGGETPSSGAAGEAGAAGAAGEASGGEGGEYTVPEPLPSAPTVISVFPRDGISDADPLVPIRINFSEPLDGATVTSDSVQLKDETGAVVSGSVSYADAVVTIRPVGRLNLLGKYTVNVGTAVTDAGKSAMEAAFSSSFTVRDGQWARIDNPLTSSTSAFDRSGAVSLASDHVGRAVAVWAQVTDLSTNYDIYAAIFNQGRGWATPVKVNTNAVRCQYPSVAMNASGNLIVGWLEYDPALPAQPYSVQARRNIAGTWDAASTHIDVPTMSAFILNLENVVVAISDNNHAHVVWSAWDYNSTAMPTVNDYAVFARHADAAGTWDATQSPLTYLQVGSGVSPPALAFDAGNNGFAAYQFTANTVPVTTKTFVFRYVSSTNKWGVSAVASTTSDSYGLPVAVATNPTGEAVLAYARATTIDAGTFSYELMGSYYNKAWSAPVVISTAKTAISSSKTMASATWTGAKFLVAWAQSGGTLSNVYVNEYKAAWGSATIISDGNHSAALPWLTADARGNALAVWYQNSDTPASGSLIPSDVVFSRLVGATDKWSNAGRVSSVVAGYRFPQVAILKDGTAVAAWQRVINNANIKTLAVNGVLENDFQ